MILVLARLHRWIILVLASAIRSEYQLSPALLSFRYDDVERRLPVVLVSGRGLRVRLRCLQERGKESEMDFTRTQRERR